MKIIVIGGVAGGATAAARIRRLSEEAEIILFERGFYVSYANCGLPYYIGGEIEKRDDLFIASPERLKNRYGIDVRTSQEVIEIDRNRKRIKVKKHENRAVFFETYDKLILSPGAEPTRPPIPGIDIEGIFTLRDLPDTDAIMNYLDNNQLSSALVIGGGAIGLECAENISRRGVNVTIIEMSEHVLPSLDYEMAVIIHRHLRDQEIELHLGDSVQSFHRKGEGISAVTHKGMIFETDMALISIGVKPENKLAKTAGLLIGDKGGISVDEMLRTSDPDIYAVGDAVEVRDYISGVNRLVPLAGPANREGRVAADNAVGRRTPFQSVLGTNITKVFDMAAASTGNNEKDLKARGEPYLISFTHSFHHATYYPEAKPMAVKLLFTPKGGKLLGGQIVGYEGVDKRIDVIATAIKGGMTVFDLENLELAYAPQFGSAKDPINIAGFVAANILKKDVEVVHWQELDGLDWNLYILLDVRSDIEVKQTGTIRNAVHIHIDELRGRLNELDKKKIYIAYCAVSLRGYIAYRMLVQNGFEARILSGGFETWEPLYEDNKERMNI